MDRAEGEAKEEEEAETESRRLSALSCIVEGVRKRTSGAAEGVEGEVQRGETEYGTGRMDDTEEGKSLLISPCCRGAWGGFEFTALAEGICSCCCC